MIEQRLSFRSVEHDDRERDAAGDLAPAEFERQNFSAANAALASTRWWSQPVAATGVRRAAADGLTYGEPGEASRPAVADHDQACVAELDCEGRGAARPGLPCGC
jgi:hypothetical protein